MIRRLNFTNRIKIKREDVMITVLDTDKQILFEANLSGLAKYNLPSESFVFVEAYRMSNWMRFSFGQVGKITHPKSLALKSFTSYEGIKFRVKITAAGQNHMLLAEADAIPLLTKDQKKSDKDPLLPVIPSDELGDEIYRVDYSEGNPILLINSSVGNYKNIGLSPSFVSLALPAVLREILTKIVLIDKRIDDDDMDDWHCRWIKFSTQLLGYDELPSTEDLDECAEWIQSISSAFARKQNLKSQFKGFWRDDS
jgi:hypothetical protein